MAPRKSTMTNGVKRTGKSACATGGGDLDAPGRVVGDASAPEADVRAAAGRAPKSSGAKIRRVKTATGESLRSPLQSSSRPGGRGNAPAKRRAQRNHRGLAKAEVG